MARGLVRQVNLNQNQVIVDFKLVCLAVCNASKDCEVKCSLTMRHKPSKEDDDKGLYEVNVLKKVQHIKF